MYILGINAYHGNASAALLRDGELVAAAEEERFNRVKYAAGFPVRAIRYCLEEAGIEVTDLDHVAIPRDPWARMGRKLLYAARMPRFALDRLKVMGQFAGIEEELPRAFGVERSAMRAQYHRIEHHLAHLGSAFFVSPFEEAALLSADGLGDFASTMWGVGRGGSIEVQGSVSFPHSLGMYYSALTQYLGFWKFGEEFKVMGLAAYGEADRMDAFRRIVRSANGSGFRLNLDYFTHQRQGPELTWRESDRTPTLGRLFDPELERLLGPARTPDQPLGDEHHAVAASMQARLEEVLFELVNAIHERTGQRRLCLAGGVAFNCVANAKFLDETPFEEIYVQPAAGDAGLAVGAAYHVQHEVLKQPRGFVMDHAYWGPGYDDARIRAAVAESGFASRELPDDTLLSETAELIADGNILGWFQGRMEWGPRALGNRSIVVDPRRKDMKEILNRRVKHREPFRPFAPSILEEATGTWFEHSHPSPFMALAYSVRPEKRDDIPAPTHVDGTGRLQTVSRATNPRYWGLIKAFEERTGVPVLLNTSFNDNEPIVCTPEDALSCFARTKLDVLVIGNHVIEKPAEQG